VVASNHAGFTGTGFVDYNAVAGGFVEFTVNAPAAGSVTLTFRYANGSTANRPMDIAVGGAVVAPGLAFPPTGAWTTWATVSTTAMLNAGSNKVRATATVTAGGPNLDRLDVTAGGGAALSVVLDDGSPATWRDVGGGVIEIDLPRDREALVTAAGSAPPLTIAPVPISRTGAAWGLP
jgi:hypothetical protein